MIIIRLGTSNMDTSSADRLLFLRENVHDIRRLGSDWGFSEETIERCASKAMCAPIPGHYSQICLQDISWENLAIWFKQLQRKTSTRTQVVIVVLCVVFFGYMGVAAAGQGSYIGECMRDIEYSFSFYTRLLAVPFHRLMKMEDFYSSECLVDNPLYILPEPECDSCKNNKGVKELKVKIKTLKLHLLSYPLVHRGLQAPVLLEDVQSAVRKEKDQLMHHPVDCTAGWAAKASDLARDDLLEQITAEKNFSCVWNSKEKMFLGQLMRRMFPRPSIIPPETEIALQKYIYIDGHGGQQRTLPPSAQGGYSWYAQGQGKRKVVFNSPEGCVDICNTFQITMKEGDILTFPSGIWTVNVEENGEETSVGFLGHILP
ncbi:uncharacterized protein LOC124277772 [Haliotis rubra]|uniref:uncharacterized protein LOC124277772 n=1 Tax=Haliotis rubra TaxID=36100 RepID=UPI001EE57D60|nr:uncharacterized protein LOC124277772 [Haliotis rubra]